MSLAVYSQHRYETVDVLHSLIAIETETDRMKDKQSDGEINNTRDKKKNSQDVMPLFQNLVSRLAYIGI